MAAQINTIGVVGTGVIGASWTALFLSKGLKVIVADPAPNAEQNLRSHLEQMWPALKILGLAQGASIDNFKFVGGSIASHGQELDFVQESGPERVDLKTKIIAEIDHATRPDVVIASSSSGLPSSQFVAECRNPERVLIGHPFNPPHLMPLVEVVPHPGTSLDAGAAQTTLAFYESLGKAPVLVKKEVPGFAANRLQAALVNEAYSLVHRGILTAEEVDKCVTSSLGPRWASLGPYMSNVLAGGSAGFKHFMEHLAPASQIWTDEMKANEFKFTPESTAGLDSSVQAMLEKYPVSEAEKYRDAVTLDLLKLKKDKAGMYFHRHG